MSVAASLDVSPNIVNVSETWVKQSLSGGQRKVLSFVEEFLGHIVHEIRLRPLGRPSISLRHVVGVKIYVNPATNAVQREIVARQVTYTFPGKNKGEAWRFGVSDVSSLFWS